jgi:hypothetical protein
MSLNLRLTRRSSHPHPYRLQPTVHPLSLSSSAPSSPSSSSYPLAGSSGSSGIYSILTPHTPYTPCMPYQDQEDCDLMYKLDLGAESPYLGTAYAEAFSSKVLPRPTAGSPRIDSDSCQGCPSIATDDKGKRSSTDSAPLDYLNTHCGIWYVFLAFTTSFKDDSQVVLKPEGSCGAVPDAVL